LNKKQKKGRSPFIIAGAILAVLGIINLIIVTFFGS
jgi:hypothetical protein